MKPVLQALQISGGIDERLRILASGQTIDIRMGERGVVEGPLALIDYQIPFSVMVDVVYVRYCRLGDVTREEYEADGYSSQEALLSDLQGYYTDATLDSIVTVIKYTNVRGFWVTNRHKYLEFFNSCL